ncbi:MAG: serine/threonine-protein kinase [Planctomycetota bacterium]
MIKLQAGEYLGSYRVQKFLGRGAFAYVYLAEDTEGRKVALKVGDIAGGGRYVTRYMEITDERSQEWISPDETPGEAVFFRPDGIRVDFLDQQEIDMLIRSEASLLEGARHQNLVQIHDVFEVEGRPILVMDYVRGKTLREKIRALEGIRLNWFLTIVRALQKLGSTGNFAYHGDLKPENILVKPSGSAVLIDPALRTSKQTLISTTPHYNPLLLRSPKADVMGIGVMLYEILTGTLPFDEVPWQYAGREHGGEVERLSLSYFLSYPPPRTLNPNTPEALERITYRCLTVMEYGLADLETDLVDFLRKE